MSLSTIDTATATNLAPDTFTNVEHLQQPNTALADTVASALEHANSNNPSTLIMLALADEPGAAATAQDRGTGGDKAKPTEEQVDQKREKSLIELKELPLGDEFDRKDRLDWLKDAAPKFRDGLAELYHERHGLSKERLQKTFNQLRSGKLNNQRQSQIKKLLQSQFGRDWQKAKSFLAEGQKIMRVGSEAIRMTEPESDGTLPQERAFEQLERMADALNKRYEQTQKNRAGSRPTRNPTKRGRSRNGAGGF